MDRPGTPHLAQSRRGRINALLLSLAVGAFALVAFASTAGAATFNANPATLGAIPDGTSSTPCAPGPPRNVEFSVVGLQGPITDVQVSFAFSPQHDFVGDVNAVLIAPGGPSHSIFGRTGAAGASDLGDSSNLVGPYTFADGAPALPKWWDAAGAVDTDTAVPSGSYRASTAGGAPAGGSSTLITPTFAGLASPNGTWTLQFRDCTSGLTTSVSAATLGIAAPSSAQASNLFSFGKVKLNKNKGTATLTVDVPGAGNVTLGGKGIVKQRPAAGGTALTSKAVSSAGKVKLKIKAKGAKKTKLNDKGKVTVRPKITFTPTGGTAFTQSKKIKLKKNL